MHRPPQATSLPGPARALAAPRAGLHHPLRDFPAECKMQQRLQTCQKQYTHWVVYPHWEGGAAKASLRGAKHRSPFQARVRSALTEAQPRAEAQGERAPGGGEKPPRVCTWRPWLPHTPAGGRPVQTRPRGHGAAVPPGRPGLHYGLFTWHPELPFGDLCLGPSSTSSTWDPSGGPPRGRPRASGLLRVGTGPLTAVPSLATTHLGSNRDTCPVP